MAEFRCYYCAERFETSRLLAEHCHEDHKGQDLTIVRRFMKPAVNVNEFDKEVVPPAIVENHSALKDSLTDWVGRNYNNPANCDVMIFVEDDIFFLHKFVLQQSPVFRVMFSEPWSEANRRSEANRQEIRLLEADWISKQAMDTFFRFLYGMKICLDWPLFLPLAVLANKYGVDALQKECDRHTQMMLLSLADDYSNIIEMMRRAGEMNLLVIHAECEKFLALNLFDLLRKYKSECPFFLDELVVLLGHKSALFVCPQDAFCSILTWVLDLRRKISDEQNNKTETLTQGQKHASVPIAERDIGMKIVSLLDYRLLRMEELVQAEACVTESMGLAAEDDRFNSVLQRLLKEAYQFHGLTFQERCDNDLTNPSHLTIPGSPELFPWCDDDKTYAHFMFHTTRECTISANVEVAITSSNADLDNCQSWSIQVYNTNTKSDGAYSECSVRATCERQELPSDIKFKAVLQVFVLRFRGNHRWVFVDSITKKLLVDPQQTSDAVDKDDNESGNVQDPYGSHNGSDEEDAEVEGDDDDDEGGEGGDNEEEEGDVVGDKKVSVGVSLPRDLLDELQGSEQDLWQLNKYMMLLVTMSADF